METISGIEEGTDTGRRGDGGGPAKNRFYQAREFSPFYSPPTASMLSMEIAFMPFLSIALPVTRTVFSACSMSLSLAP